MLTNFQVYIYNIGGLAMLAGAVLPSLLSDTTPAPFIFGTGALMFCSMQLLARYDGHNIVIRRLRRQQMTGAFALIIAAALMFCSQYKVGPFQGAEWQVILGIGAVLELYTAFRLPAEMKKDN